MATPVVVGVGVEGGRVRERPNVVFCNASEGRSTSGNGGAWTHRM
jgi:hypothetical protein